MKLLPRFLGIVLATAVFGLSAGQTMALPPAGEERVYKGVSLIGTTYPNRNSKDFFRLATLAIDMLEQLPKAEWNHGRLIGKIVYDPPSPHRKAEGVKRNIVAVYTLQPDDEWPAPVVMYKSAKYASALQLALSMIGNGFHARDHRMRRDIVRDLKAADAGSISMSNQQSQRMRADYARISARQSGNMTPDEILKYDCEIQIGVYEALKILHPEDRSINVRARSLSDRGCW